MPQVFDNIDLCLLPALQSALSLSDRADFCVGYFNLRGWKELDSHIQHWFETDGACRLLVGMQKPPQEQLREVSCPKTREWTTKPPSGSKNNLRKNSAAS